jgi:hypothetical protein
MDKIQMMTGQHTSKATRQDIKCDGRSARRLGCRTGYRVCWQIITQVGLLDTIQNMMTGQHTDQAT